MIYWLKSVCSIRMKRIGGLSSRLMSYLTVLCSTTLALSQSPSEVKITLPDPLPSVKTEDEKKQCSRLKERIKKIKQWYKATDYTKQDWVYLLKLAQEVQKMPENVVYEAMHDFGGIDARTYLLLKVMFYRPIHKVKDFPGLIGVGSYTYTMAISKVNKEDIPIDWQLGFPRFIASRSGIGSGVLPSYPVLYLYLNRCYSLRKIRIPSGWETSPLNTPKSKLGTKPTQQHKPPQSHSIPLRR